MMKKCNWWNWIFTKQTEKKHLGKMTKKFMFTLFCFRNTFSWLTILKEVSFSECYQTVNWDWKYKIWFLITKTTAKMNTQKTNNFTKCKILEIGANINYQIQRIWLVMIFWKKIMKKKKKKIKKKMSKKMKKMKVSKECLEI